MLALPFAAPALASGKPLRFGVVADPQYADADPNLQLNRYFRATPDKLREALSAFNGETLDFVVTLGDLIDRDVRSYATIMPIYETLRHRHVRLLGNHDYSVAADELADAPRRLGLERPYYDFAAGGIRFIVLDGNDVSVFAPPAGDPRRQLASERIAQLAATGAENAKPWNGSLSEDQFAWLTRMLDEAHARSERVIVMNHYPVFPQNMHNMWDSERVVSLLAGRNNVVGYFCGHNHAGNYGDVAGLHFVNFHGMVDTPDTSAFAIVEIDAERLEIRGSGREPNRTLKLRA